MLPTSSVLLVFPLSPNDTRHCAKAVGLRGKTDRVVAELTARMIAREHPKLHACMPPTASPFEIDARLTQSNSHQTPNRAAASHLSPVVIAGGSNFMWKLPS